MMIVKHEPSFRWIEQQLQKIQLKIADENENMFQSIKELSYTSSFESKKQTLDLFPARPEFR